MLCHTVNDYYGVSDGHGYAEASTQSFARVLGSLGRNPIRRCGSCGYAE
jgi:hypothetical protein